MGWTAPAAASVCAKRGPSQVHAWGAVRDAGYHDRARSGQERLSGARGRLPWTGSAAQAAFPVTVARVLRQSAALRDRHGGLRRGAPLGARAASAWP